MKDDQKDEKERKWESDMRARNINIFWFISKVFIYQYFWHFYAEWSIYQRLLAAKAKESASSSDDGAYYDYDNANYDDAEFYADDDYDYDIASPGTWSNNLRCLMIMAENAWK